jgi:hypothetical protein
VRVGERQQALDALLPVFYDLWHPQPFRENQPDWSLNLPALADELLKLADPDVACLNEDGAAALDLLARHVPAVAEIAGLADLPRRPGNALVEQRASWAWEIPGRKRQQIEAFASASQCGAGSVIDWCGGKGHLGRLLAAQWQVPVHTLEIDAALCAEGAALANRQRLSHEFLNIDALTAADWPKRGQHAVALHACGDLHRRLIAQGADVGVARFDVAPCCYYRGVASTYQALSGNLHTALTRDDVRLAVTETVTASARLTVQRDKEMAWKLGFDAYRRAPRSGAVSASVPSRSKRLRQTPASNAGCAHQVIDAAVPAQRILLGSAGCSSCRSLHPVRGWPAWPSVPVRTA